MNGIMGSGCGPIGQMHAGNIADRPPASLALILAEAAYRSIANNASYPSVKSAKQD